MSMPFNNPLAGAGLLLLVAMATDEKKAKVYVDPKKLMQFLVSTLNLEIKKCNEEDNNIIKVVLKSKKENYARVKKKDRPKGFKYQPKIKVIIKKIKDIEDNAKHGNLKRYKVIFYQEIVRDPTDLDRELLSKLLKKYKSLNNKLEIEKIK